MEHIACMENEKCYTKFWSKNMKRQLVGPRHRWLDNIKMNIKIKGVEWLNLARDIGPSDEF
jgi:hypothetical protein